MKELFRPTDHVVIITTDEDIKIEAYLLTTPTDTVLKIVSYAATEAATDDQIGAIDPESALALAEEIVILLQDKTELDLHATSL